MASPRQLLTRAGTLLILGAGLALAACSSWEPSMDRARLTELATRYAAAWSSHDPDSLAAFYDVRGYLKVNGVPSVGRAAIRTTAAGYMRAFPDMAVSMDSVVQRGSRTFFHWTWTGTNSGPGGTGRAVHIRGYEEWTFGANGLIKQSLGHYDEAEYQRQVTGGGPSGP